MGSCLKEMFADCVFGDENRAIYAPVVSVEIDRNKEAVEIRIALDAITSKKTLRAIAGAVGQSMGIRRVKIAPRYTADLFSHKYLTEIIDELGNRDKLVNGFLDEAAAAFDGHALTISLRHGGKGMLEMAGVPAEIVKIVQEEFGITIECGLESPDFQPSQTMERLDIAADIPVKSPGAVKPARNADDSPVCANPPHDPESPIAICDLRTDMDTVCVVGEVFRYDRDVKKDGALHIVTIYLTDYTESVIIKKFLKGKHIDELKDIKTGDTIRVTGKYRYDEYAKCSIIEPTSIKNEPITPKTDDADRKRVELHLHTNMSAQDGINKIEDYIDRALQYGHKGLAITDHAVAQAFPDAMNYVKRIRKGGTDFKVVYGIEGYVVDDSSVYGGKEDDSESLDGTFIIFDVETTGLSPKTERLTEIGAIKVNKGQIVDKFETYVNPQKPISQFITDLTGITDETVRDAPLEGEAVKAFIKFCEGHTVVAHNAEFDVSFIKSASSRHRLKFTNGVIDTVAIARKLYPQLPNHKLDTLAAHLKAEQFNHHRATDDAKALAHIFEEMRKELSDDYNIATVSGLGNWLRESHKENQSYHIIILCKNQTGLKNLYKLISYSNLLYFYRKPRIPKSELRRHREGLIIGSACEAGELYTAVRSGKSKAELTRIAKEYDYLEIQPLCNNEFLTKLKPKDGNERILTFNDLQKFNRIIYDLGRELNIPVVATGDVHFRDKSDAIFRTIHLDSMDFSDADNCAPLYFRTTDEMLNEFDYFDEEIRREIVIDNPVKIFDECDYLLPIPEGSFVPVIEGADDELRQMCYSTARGLYGDTLPDIVEARLQKELKSIIGNGFATLYIAAQRLVRKSLDDGYIVGSRGSVGSSLVAAMAGISEINPLPPHYRCPNCRRSDFDTGGVAASGYDLPSKNCPVCSREMIGDGNNIPFETFLGFKGEKSPDIDLNFSGEYQAKAHKYTEELFGEGYTFKAGTISTVAYKTAYAYVCKYLEKRNKTANPAEIARLTSGVEGVKKTTGQHPGGMIIVPQGKEIYDFTPIQRPAERQGGNVVTTHFDFTSLHDTLLKLDILGHDIPTLYKRLEETTELKISDVSMSDPLVYELFTSSEPLKLKDDRIPLPTGTLGLPEMGTAFVRRMLCEARPKTFADLTQISGLSHGTDVWNGNARELIENKTCTISEVIGTRDSIMTYLISKGIDEELSFNITEHTRKGKAISFLTPEIEERLLSHGVPEWYIGSLKKIKYMFPKAHAAAYVMSSVKMGYFKIYRPIQYYSAVFSVKGEAFDLSAVSKGIDGVYNKICEYNSRSDKLTQKEQSEFDCLEITYEMLARGFEFLNVDIRKSHAFDFIIEDGALRIPFIALKGTGATAAQKLYETARGAKFTTAEEFLNAACVSTAIVMELKGASAFGDLPESNQISF